MFKIKAYRIISPSQKSRKQHVYMYQIKYHVKINNKKISLSFHDLILFISKWRYMVPVSRLLQLREIRSRLTVSPPKQSSSIPNFTLLQHVTPDKSQFLFYQELIKENKTFLTMFYTLIGFHLV